MDSKGMAKITDEVFGRVKEIALTKGLEYATDRDRLADFKEVGETLGISPGQVWCVYVSKHQRAIAAFIREGAVKSEPIEDRVLDVIMYHVLLLGLIADGRAGATG